MWWRNEGNETKPSAALSPSCLVTICVSPPPRPVAWTSRSKDFVLKIWRRKFTRGICRGSLSRPMALKPNHQIVLRCTA